MGRKIWITAIMLLVTTSMFLVLSSCSPKKISPGDRGVSQTGTQDDIYTTSGGTDSRTGEDMEGSESGTGTTEEDIRQREIDEQIAREQRQQELETKAFVNMDIHFAYDSFALTPEAIQILNEKVDYLKKYPNTRILVEGHCDERGTAEYNMALGERRAESAKSYLIRNGIRPDRIDTISYGEEKPIAMGHNEEAWRQNRRAHFVIK